MEVTPPSDREPGVPTMASYGLGRFITELLTGAFSAIVFKFYETEVGLAVGLVALGFVVHSIWNAVTYPLVGYLTGKPTFLSARWGRRFPWIVVGAPLSLVTFLLVFIPPSGATPFVLFAWMVVASCLFDLFTSLWELNYQSVFPDKFRSFAGRNKAAGIGTLVGTFGVVGGAILPTLFIVYGDPGSYLKSALVIAGIGVAAAFLLVPGVRETKAMVDRFTRQAALDAGQRRPFFRQLREAFTHKNFVAFILLYFFYQAAVITMQSSIYYVGDYVLGGQSTTLLFAAMLLGALVSIPLWTAWAKRTQNNQKSLFVGALALALFSFPMTFLNDYTPLLVCMFLWGLAFGGFWFLLNPAMADVVDEIVVKTGRRDDGVFYGFRSFFGRLSMLVQAVSFWAIHEVTGFHTDPRSAAAIGGIHVHQALLPALLIVVGALVFWKLNDLTPERCAANRRQLHERGL